MGGCGPEGEDGGVESSESVVGDQEPSSLSFAPTGGLAKPSLKSPRQSSIAIAF